VCRKPDMCAVDIVFTGVLDFLGEVMSDLTNVF
jgi:hypothetical protein